MDLPAHLLWTYALERTVAPEFIVSHPEFVIASLFFSALPDLFESAPFLLFIIWHRKKYQLKNLSSILAFVVRINHIKQNEYSGKFPWAAKMSFYTHSFLLSAFFAIFLYFVFKWLFIAFLIGYCLHLFIDIFLHKDFFSARPLYPLSNFTVKGLITWYKVKNFSTYNYSLLAVVYLILIIL